MFNVKTISILAIAGTAVAAPQGWGNWAANYFANGRNGGGSVATTVEVVTAYTTVTYDGKYRGGNWNKPQSTVSAVVTAAPSPEPEAPSSSAAPPSSSAAPVDSGSSDGYMGIVSEWRSKMGLSSLTQDSTLEGNAHKTAQDGNGQMVHQLNPGSFAQVLAPGSPDEFEKVFVGGWLCERPNLAGLDGVCTTMSQGWDYAGQTGHADILVSKSYSKIGCGNAGGIWACDLA